MRILVVAALFLFAVVLVPAQQQQQHAQTNPGSPCGSQSEGLPGFYYDHVLEQIKPPDWEKSLIRISEGGERKLMLWTNGEKFKLWTDTPDIPQKSINDFLFDLDDSCRLPADPAEAAALIKFKWESKDLSPDQFAQLHRDFTAALSQYVSKTQERYSSLITTGMSVSYLDAVQYPIVYDNAFEHIEVEVWNDPKQDRPMIEWVHGLKKLAMDSFQRPFEAKPSE